MFTHFFGKIHKIPPKIKRKRISQQKPYNTLHTVCVRSPSSFFISLPYSQFKYNWFGAFRLNNNNNYGLIWCLSRAECARERPTAPACQQHFVHFSITIACLAYLVHPIQFSSCFDRWTVSCVKILWLEPGDSDWNGSQSHVNVSVWRCENSQVIEKKIWIDFVLSLFLYASCNNSRFKKMQHAHQLSLVPCSPYKEKQLKTKIVESIEQVLFSHSSQRTRKQILQFASYVAYANVFFGRILFSARNANKKEFAFHLNWLDP